MRQVRNYSAFLNNVASLIGIPSDRISTEIAASLNSSFNSAMQEMWIRGPWKEVSFNGEARFVGNRLTYPNDAAQTSFWTATALTISSKGTFNPADGRKTASKLLETSATSSHKIVQTVDSFLPSTVYTASFYVRPNGRTNVQLVVFDGDSTFSAFFNLTGNGTIGNTSGTDTATATIATRPNGFWLCSFGFTTSENCTSGGTYSLLLSPNGSTTSYAGDTTKGVYVWGNLIQQIQSPQGANTGGTVVSGGNSYSAYTNNSGDTTITPTSGNEWSNLSIGGSARTSNIILSTAGRSAGDRLTIVVSLPATGSIFLDFRNSSSVGTELLPVLTYPSHLLETPGTAMTGTFNFGFDGSAWEFIDGTLPS